MSGTTRRGFLAGCSAAIAGLAGSRFDSLLLGQPSENDEILLVVSLRGGMDGLNLVLPIDGDDRSFYEIARPLLKIPASGKDAAIPLDSLFGLHPAAGGLGDLYQDGKVAAIHAAGLPGIGRSHFQAIDAIDIGSKDNAVADGWLTRHFQTATNYPPSLVAPSLSVGCLQHRALRGSFESLNMKGPESFNLETGPPLWRSAQRSALRKLYNFGSNSLHETGIQTLDALDVVELYVTSDYVPTNGAVYPEGGFGDNLATIAQMIKLNLGLKVATVELGGWDTHEGQGVGTQGYFATLIEELSAGLTALYTDLDGAAGQNYTSRLTMVVQSEFGRKLRENGDIGTDHGSGGVIIVVSGNAIGGVHGEWPGLAAEQLLGGTDLEVTTDYRRIMSEILIRRMGNSALSTIFPGYEGYEPLGFVLGEDLPPT